MDELLKWYLKPLEENYLIIQIRNSFLNTNKRKLKQKGFAFPKNNNLQGDNRHYMIIPPKNYDINDIRELPEIEFVWTINQYESALTFHDYGLIIDNYRRVSNL